MDDFSLFLQKSMQPMLSERDQAFTGSKESIYQRKLMSFQESVSNVVFSILVCSFTLNSILAWDTFSYLKMVELGLCMAGVGVIASTTNLISQGTKPSRSKPTRPGARGAGTLSSSLPSLPHLLLVGLQEVVCFSLTYNRAILSQSGETLPVQGSTSSLLVWLAWLGVSLLTHCSMLEPLHVSRNAVAIRAVLQFLTLFFSGSFFGAFKGLIVVTLGYLININALYRLNKLMRSEFFSKDVQNKFLNQFFTIMDSMPYPVMVFDPSKSGEDKEKAMPLIYFNFAGNDLVAGKERVLDLQDNNRPVNFLDLIDPQDEGTLLDNIELIKQDKTSAETMTTEVAREILDSKVKTRVDITLWKMKWMERDVIVALFNNDAYKPKKQESRFSSKYIEGLEHMLSKNSEIISTAIANLKLYKESKIQDPKVLYEQMTYVVSDLAITKSFNENLLLGEPWSKADELKTFNPRIMIINTVDLLSKEIKSKDISLRVEFNRGFPQNLIETKAILMRAMFFNLIYYIQNRLHTGNILIQCDRQDLEEEEDRSMCNLVFRFKIESVRDSDLPPRNFLINSSGATITLPQLKPLPSSGLEAKLIGWLTFIKEELDVKVESYNPNTSDKGDR